MLAYSVLADAFLRELDDMPITEAELVKDGWEDKGCIYGPTTSKQLVWKRGQDVLARYISKESDQWELVGVPEFELQTMGDLRTVLRLRGESA